MSGVCVKCVVRACVRVCVYGVCVCVRQHSQVILGISLLIEKCKQFNIWSGRFCVESLIHYFVTATIIHSNIIVSINYLLPYNAVCTLEKVYKEGTIV